MVLCPKKQWLLFLRAHRCCLLRLADIASSLQAHTETHKMCWQGNLWSRKKAWNETCKLLCFPSLKHYQLAESQFYFHLRACKDNWTEGTGKLPSVSSQLSPFWLCWFHSPPRKIFSAVFSLVAAESVAVSWMCIMFWQSSIFWGGDTRPCRFIWHPQTCSDIASPLLFTPV